MKLFLWGVFVGIAVTLAGFGIHYGFNKIKSRLRNFVSYNEEAITHIRGEGFSLSKGITDTYFFCEYGMQDQTVFLAFSGPQQELDEIAKQKTGKDIADWQPWHGQIDELPLVDMYEPGNWGAKYRTMYYNIDFVKSGRYFQNHEPKNGNAWYIIYDRERSRMYYCRPS